MTNDGWLMVFFGDYQPVDRGLSPIIGIPFNKPEWCFNAIFLDSKLHSFRWNSEALLKWFAENSSWCCVAYDWWIMVVGDGTWWKPFHRPVPRTRGEHYFITSKGLSLACFMCLVHLSMYLLAGMLEHVYCIGRQWAWGWLQQPGRRVMKTISQTCSENSWGTSFHNI